MKKENKQKQSDLTRGNTKNLVKFRHRIVYFLLKPPIRLFVWIAFNFHPVRYADEDKRQPYFILSNHNGSLDSLMLTLSFRQPIYFVASDHLFRMGFISRMLVWLAAPIPIVKSQIDLHAMRHILKVRQEKGTTCLFPSGNRSFTGPEMPIPPATGKLVKHLRCPVLLYRFEGGYLTSPRWAKTHRKGHLTGKVVRELGIDELSSLTAQQINEIIVQELDANPYQYDRKTAVSYKGRDLAEYLERILFVCPVCERLNSLRSSGSQLRCECGFEVEYEADGWFNESNANYSSIVEKLPNTAAFDKFQREFLQSQFSDHISYNNYLSMPIFEDNEETLIQTSRASHSTVRLNGKLSLFADRLTIANEFETLTFPLNRIGRFIVHGPQVLQFHDSQNDIVYELKSDKPRSAYKYVLASELLRLNSTNITR